MLRRVVEAKLHCRKTSDDKSGEYAISYLQGKGTGLSKFAVEVGVELPPWVSRQLKELNAMADPDPSQPAEASKGTRRPPDPPRRARRKRSKRR
jgi:hypothetical protein